MADEQTTSHLDTGNGVGLGIALGVAFGAAYGNVGLGIALGICFGAALGPAFGQCTKSESDSKSAVDEKRPDDSIDSH
ncbi:MAG: hypothetical protein P8J37_08465 [Fuerstiella sp.]|nr:hypothetical protein [Fuerstiella sp.]